MIDVRCVSSTIASKDIDSETAGWILTKHDPYMALFKAAYSVTMNIFRKKNIFFLNHL